MTNTRKASTRRQTRTTDYFAVVTRGPEEIQLGPYHTKTQAVMAASRHGKAGDEVAIERNTYVYTNGAPMLTNREKLTNLGNGFMRRASN